MKQMGQGTAAVADRVWQDAGGSRPELRVLRGGTGARRPFRRHRSARRLAVRAAVRPADREAQVVRLPEFPVFLRPIPAWLPRLW